MEHHNKINKNKQPSLTPKNVQTKGAYLQDNRPSSILQKNNTLNTKLTTIQRKISYNAGRYENREALIGALEAIFEENAHQPIIYWVNAYENSKGWAQYASTVYNYIIGHLKVEG